MQSGLGQSEDVKTVMMKHLFKAFKTQSGQSTVTGLSEQAEGLLSKAVEIWPVLSKPFQIDPIDDVIKREGHERRPRVKELLPDLDRL